MQDNNDLDNILNTEDIEETYDIISIIDENNESIECFVIDAILVENTNYLLVVPCEAFDEEESEAFILKQINEQDDTVIYVPVENDNEYNKILILFQENDTDYEIKF